MNNDKTPETIQDQAKILKKRFKNYEPPFFENLEDKNYPIGHATGLNGKEWRKFAVEEYKIGRFDHLKPTTVT